MANFSALSQSEGLQEGSSNKQHHSSCYHCCVPRCNGDSRYNSSLHFHRFPGRESEKKLRAQWVVKIRRDEGPLFKITTSTRVCSQHFTLEDYRPPDKAGRQILKKGAVPSVFDWSQEHKARRKILRTNNSDDVHEYEDIKCPEEDKSQSQLSDKIESLEEKLNAAKNELEKYRKEKLDVELESEKIRAMLIEEINQLKRSAAEQLALHKFGLERFSTDNDSIKFYTGFPSYLHIKSLFEIAKPSAEYMRYCYASGERESRPGSRHMQLIDEFFMFIIRLRLGLLEQDLADRFQIHMSTVSRKITTWANFLYFLLGSQPIWPSRKYVKSKMPDEFCRLYPSTRVILDCTEIFVQTPSSLVLQSQMYSSYKSTTTLKGLIGIAPHGAISFVSSLYTGSISDKEITRCSGVLDLLEPGDSVMADKGFIIADLLSEKGVSLNIPPFLERKSQFLPQDVLVTKSIAKLRIHVERAIRRVKENHFFDSDVPLSMLGSINQMYTVACLLTNFQGPLIIKK